MIRKIKLNIFLILILLSSLACSDIKKFSADNHDEQNLNDAKIAVYEKRILQDPKSFPDYNRLAHLYIQKARETGDNSFYGKAETILKRSIHINPVNYTALVYLGLVSISKHDFENAMKYGIKARDMNPEISYAYGIIGDAFKELGDIQRAEQVYNTMAELNPSLDSYSRISSIKAVKGDTTGAIEAMHKAYEYGVNQASPKENIAWTQVMTGSLYFNAGNLNTAEMYYKKGLVIMENYYLALEHIAEINAVKGNYNMALDLYNTVLKTNPEPEYFLAKAGVLENLGRADEAERNKLKARELLENRVERGDADYLRALANFYAYDEIELDRSLALALKDFKIRKDPHAYDTLAWIYYKKGEYEEALKYSEQSLESGIKDAVIYYHAGILNYKNGYKEKAEKYLELAIKTNPYFDKNAVEKSKEILSSLKI